LVFIVDLIYSVSGRINPVAKSGPSTSSSSEQLSEEESNEAENIPEDKIPIKVSVTFDLHSLAFLVVVCNVINVLTNKHSILKQWFIHRYYARCSRIVSSFLNYLPS